MTKQRLAFGRTAARAAYARINATTVAENLVAVRAEGAAAPSRRLAPAAAAASNRTNASVDSLARTGRGSHRGLAVGFYVAGLLGLLWVFVVFAIPFYYTRGSGTQGTTEDSKRHHFRRKSSVPEVHGRDLRSQQPLRNPKGESCPTLDDPYILPLCSALVVPGGTALECCIKNAVQHCRQEIVFDVATLPERGGVPLLQVCISESSSTDPGISIKTVNGQEQLAFLSTAGLWKGGLSPVLDINRTYGLPFGTFRQCENGEYHLFHGQTMLLIFSGDFEGHNVRVRKASGRQVAFTAGVSEEVYKLSIQANTDAGLVILGLLAADKYKIPAGTPAARGPTKSVCP